MVRNYVRKTEDKWTKEDLLDALTNIKDSKIKINDAAKEYQISRATLYRQFKKFLQAGGKIDVNQFKTCGGNPILSKIEEDVLVKTILDLREQGYTVTSTDIKRICYEYCDTNGIPNQFNAEKRLASDDWYYGYLKRHPEIRTIDPSAPPPAPKATKKSKAVVKTEPLVLVKEELVSNGDEMGEEEAIAMIDDGPSTSAAAAAKSAAGTKRKASAAPKKGRNAKKAKQAEEEEGEQEINGENEDNDANGEGEEEELKEEIIEEVHSERDEAEDEGDDEEVLEEEEDEGENGHDEEVEDEEQGEVEEDDQEEEQEEGVEDEDEDEGEEVEEEEEPAEKPATGHMGTRSPKK